MRAQIPKHTPACLSKPEDRAQEDQDARSPGCVNERQFLVNEIVSEQTDDEFQIEAEKDDECDRLERQTSDEDIIGSRRIFVFGGPVMNHCDACDMNN